MSKRALLTTTTLLLAALLLTGLLSAGATASGSASKRRPFLVGIYDDTMTLGSPDKGFKTLKNLRAQVVRITLSWRAVARKRPVEGENPADKAYSWEQYDKAVQLAKKNSIKVMFSIAGTPAWANRGRSAAVAPTNFLDLQRFATAAATRYSGSFTTSDDPNAVPLPAVQLWLAWNEPNNPVFLAPQYKRVHGRWLAWSAYTYARICNAIYKGVHSAFVSGEKVGCGATDPFGNNKPKSFRPSISPLAFLRLSKKYGLRRFDAWAHHPYASRPAEKPTSKPRSKTAVTLGNFGDLTKELTRLYGKKRIWITEYGYQTRPPDHLFGVSWKNQARYLAEAFAIARKNPRVDMMIWFLVKDERRLGGWQSGFFTAAGKRKPAYTTFRALRH